MFACSERVNAGWALQGNSSNIHDQIAYMANFPDGTSGCLSRPNQIAMQVMQASAIEEEEIRLLEQEQLRQQQVHRHSRLECGPGQA